MKTKPKRTKTRLALAALLLVAGVVSITLGYLNVSEDPAPEITFDPPRAVARAVDEPSEKKPSPEAKYEVLPDMPRRLIISSIGVNGFIQQVGKHGGAVGVPDSIFTAGWYVNSVKPGEAGVSLLDGHVQGWHHEGIFKRLGELVPGQLVTVEYGDYSKRYFEVIEVSEYSAKAAKNYMLSKDPSIDRQLNLITCSGPFDSTSDEYQNRTIVVAKLVN